MDLEIKGMVKLEIIFGLSFQKNAFNGIFIKEYLA